jgi:DNA-binding beta-propeller fold protein YncE
MEDKMTSPVSLRVPKIAFHLLALVVAPALMVGCQQSLSTPVGVPTPPTTTANTGAPAPTVAPAVAYDATSNVYYVANGFAGTVTAVNATSNAVTTITVGPAGSDLYSIAVNPATDLIYVVSNQTGTMTVINGANNQVATTVPSAATLPVAVAVNSATNMVYVLGQGTQQNLNVYSGATNALVGGVAVAGTTYALAVNSVTNTVFASSVGTVTTAPATQTTPATLLSGPWLTVIDGATDAITSTVLQQNTLTALAVNQTTNTIYGSNTAQNLLTVIGQPVTPTSPQGTQWAIEANVMVGGSPGPIAVNPTTNTVYVGNTASDSISVVNGATNMLSTTPTIPLTGAPTGLAANSAANLVYVAEPTTVAVINGVPGTAPEVQTASVAK